MEEPDQLIADPDEIQEEEEVIEGLHPPSLQQQNPRFIISIITSVTSFVAANGWYAVGFLLLGYITWHKFEPKIKSWLRKREEDKEALEYHKNPDALLAKHQAIEEARWRMQEQYNIAAASSLERKKKREEKKKEEKIKEWENMQPGGGQTLKSSAKRGTSASANSSDSSAKRKPATKTSLRPEYNPLTGDTGSSSSCRWRPSTQRPSGGG